MTNRFLQVVHPGDGALVPSYSLDMTGPYLVARWGHKHYVAKVWPDEGEEEDE